MHRATVLFTLAVCLRAQSAYPFTLTGEIENAPTHFTVELINASHQTSVNRGYSTANGHFSIASVEQGHYELHVLDDSGHTLRVDYVDVSPGSGPLFIRLPQEQSPQRAVSVVVDVRDLTKERRSAVRLLEAASNRRAKNDIDGAVKKCIEAIARDPEFAMAHLELANRFMDLKRPWDARNELLRALAIDPKFVPAYTNLAIVDIKLGNVVGAEQAATHALTLNREDRRADYLKKVSLWLQHKGPKPVSSFLSPGG